MLSDFQTSRVLGVGHFGTVLLVKCVRYTESGAGEEKKKGVAAGEIVPGNLYALKMIKMSSITREKQWQHIRNESTIMHMLHSQGLSFAPLLYTTFKTDLSQIFVMELLDGITLFQY